MWHQSCAPFGARRLLLLSDCPLAHARDVQDLHAMACLHVTHVSGLGTPLLSPSTDSSEGGTVGTVMLLDVVSCGVITTGLACTRYRGRICVRPDPQGVRTDPLGVRPDAPKGGQTRPPHPGVRPDPQGVRPDCPQGVRPDAPGARPDPPGVRPDPWGVWSAGPDPPGGPGGHGGGPGLSQTEARVGPDRGLG